MNKPERNIGEYEDILNLPHPTSVKHPRMPAIDRAAQFSPYAALSGYDTAVKETARLTNERAELSDDSLAILDARYQMLLESLSDSPEVIITYFKADKKKNGGSYETVTGIVKKVDVYERILYLHNGIIIPLDDIYELNGDVFTQKCEEGL